MFDFNVGEMYANSYNSGEFIMNVTTNNASKISGAFSGTLHYYNMDTQLTETITVTDGSFNINR